MSKIGTRVDTDYVGCKDTRKSTSGGAIMIGNHLIKGWSSTQSVIALSSGEAEYYGMVKGASVSIGLRGIMSDLGVKAAVRIRTDSSAALGVAKRKGIGKIRHIEMNQLWLQEKVSDKEIEIIKVRGSENIADQMAKYTEQAVFKLHLEQIKQKIEEGRHEFAPHCE